MKFKTLIAGILLASSSFASTNIDLLMNASREPLVTEHTLLNADIIDCLDTGSCLSDQDKNKSLKFFGSGLLSSNTSFESAWSVYPLGDNETVKAQIGGKVDAEWIPNTCVIRMSHVFNKSDRSLVMLPTADEPEKLGVTLNVISGGWAHPLEPKRKAQYGYRVAEFSEYLLKKFGAPKVKLIRPDGMDENQWYTQAMSSLKGKKGIIMYVIQFSDATGHFDLWNGSRMASDQQLSDADRQEHADRYTKMAKRIYLWQ